MVNEQAIRNQITKEVFPIMAMKNYDKGIEMLKELYLKYYFKLKDIEVKRLIVYNMVVAYYYKENRDMDSIRFFIDLIKFDMDDIEGYKEENVVSYNRVLNYYRIAHEEELSKEDKIFIYNYIIDSYKRINCNDIDIKIEQVNLDILTGDFEDILSILVELHNDTKDNSFYVNGIVNTLNELEDKKWYNKAKKIISQNNLINL